ncbi:MAG: fused MFS/spermidine synthase [Candidatus Altiarchaeota archaeon]|nr:fused MFS/spermidine synthase [Candidatus Altiarchaeota archaeon]
MDNRLKFTVFISGASVMIVEILGSRIIAPYHGTSTYVWSALIGVVLASLSLGYYYGGRMADREPTNKKLSLILLFSAILVSLIPLLSDIILPLTTLLGVRIGSILAPLLLLALPGFLMGMVTPYSIKISAEKLDNIGSTSGDLYAFSTIGSIAGTFATGFVLIPYMKLSTIFFCVALMLLAASILMRFKENKLEQKFLLAAIVLFMLFHSPFYLGGRKLVHMEYSPYNQILVEDDNQTRYMFLDGSAMGAIRLDTGYTAYEYANYFEIPFLMRPGIKNVLMAGEGTGVGAIQIQANHPEAKLTISEIDPRVHEAAKKYFGLNEGPNIRMELNDVRIVARSQREKYDYIILDVFSGRNSVPYHLLTREFFGELEKSLGDDGILLMNVISFVDGPKSVILQSIAKTMRQEFNFTRFYAVNKEDKITNVIVIASKTPIPEDSELISHAVDTKSVSQTEIVSLLGRGMGDPTAMGDGIIFTDDYSPADHMYMSMMY